MNNIFGQSEVEQTRNSSQNNLLPSSSNVQREEESHSPFSFNFSIPQSHIHNPFMKPPEPEESSTSHSANTLKHLLFGHSTPHNPFQQPESSSTTKKKRIFKPILRRHSSTSSTGSQAMSPNESSNKESHVITASTHEKATNPQPISKSLSSPSEMSFVPLSAPDLSLRLESIRPFKESDLFQPSPSESTYSQTQNDAVSSFDKNSVLPFTYRGSTLAFHNVYHSLSQANMNSQISELDVDNMDSSSEKNQQGDIRKVNHHNNEETIHEPDQSPDETSESEHSLLCLYK